MNNNQNRTESRLVIRIDPHAAVSSAHTHNYRLDIIIFYSVSIPQICLLRQFLRGGHKTSHKHVGSPDTSMN